MHYFLLLKRFFSSDSPDPPSTLTKDFSVLSVRKKSMTRGGNGNSVKDTIKYFDMDAQLMPGLAALIIGKRCSGKSILMLDIISRMNKWFNFGLALTPTQSSRAKFASCMPDVMIDKQSPDRLEAFVTLINSLYDRATTQGKETRKTYLLCDDTAYDEKFMRCKTLSEIFLNGRNFGCTCILVLQYLMKVGPDLRGNADFVFVFWDNNSKNQDKIWEFWFNMMPKKTFKEVFSECTRDYGVLVMDVRRSATSRDWHDCVYWYKARQPEDISAFTLCDADFFRLNDFCKVDDSEDRKMRDATQDRVWRLGPDGRIFDAPTWVQRQSKISNRTDQDDDDDEDDVGIEEVDDDE